MARLKEKRKKKRWKGIFQLRHTTFVEYVMAYSEAQAKVQMMRRIANKQGVNIGITVTYFKENPTYSVKEEAE